MKEKMLPFSFSRGEISAHRLISTHRNVSVRDLSISMRRGESSVSQIVKRLESKGIVESERKGMKKIVNTSDRNYAITFSEMIKNEPNTPWEKILSNSNIAVIMSKITGEETFEDGLSYISKWRAMNYLSTYGFYHNPHKTRLKGNRYLVSFLEQYSDHISLKHLIEKIPAEAIIIWRKGFNCFIKIKSTSKVAIEKLPDSAVPTALTVSPDYGIQFITGDSYYYYEPKLERLSLEDVILHTLLIDPDSQTFNTYALLLSLKNRDKINFDLLLTKSKKYDLEEAAEALTDYIKSNGKLRKWPLPETKELQEVADLYDVEIG